VVASARTLGRTTEVSSLRRTALLVLVSLTVAACGRSAQGMDAHVNLSEDAGTTRGEFLCKQSSSGGCDFTLFLEDCQEPKQGSACMRQVLKKFSLKAGESSTVDRLPLGTRYCVNRQGTSDEPLCPAVPSPPPPKKPGPQTTSYPGTGASAA